jgi:hypothetical protein
VWLQTPHHPGSSSFKQKSSAHFLLNEKLPTSLLVVSWEKKDPTVLKKKLIWNEHVHELLSHYFAEVLTLNPKTTI